MGLLRAAFKSLPQLKDKLDAKIALEAFYDLHIGLNNVENIKANPLSLGRLYDEEFMFDTQGVEAKVKAFADLGIGEIFLCSIGDFLNYPRQFQKSLIKAAKLQREKKNTNVVASEEALRKLFAGQNNSGKKT